jgi:hypothetical protein
MGFHLSLLLAWRLAVFVDCIDSPGCVKLGPGGKGCGIWDRIATPGTMGWAGLLLLLLLIDEERIMTSQVLDRQLMASD